MENDEINIVDLIKPVWKKKWIILGLSTLVVLAIFFYLKSKPDVYSSQVIIRIGAILGQPIETGNNLKTALVQQILKTNDKELIAFEKEYFEQVLKLKPSVRSQKIKYQFDEVKFKDSSAVIIITYRSKFEENVRKSLKRVVELVLDRHRKIYEDTRRKIKKNIQSVNMKVAVDPRYFLSSSNYPTSVINNYKTEIVVEESRAVKKAILSFVLSLILFSLLFGFLRIGGVRDFFRSIND